VFLSYGHLDGFLVDRLKEQIEAITGVFVFLDINEIEFGDAFRQKIIQELSQTDELLVMLSPSSIKRSWIYAEIGAALALNKRIVGLMHGIGVEELQQNGALSLFGDRHHIFDPRTELTSYLNQLKDRSEAKAGTV
jgi:hypothetical protein